MNFIIPSSYRARDTKCKKGSTSPNLVYYRFCPCLCANLSLQKCTSLAAGRPQPLTPHCRSVSGVFGHGFSRRRLRAFLPFGYLKLHMVMLFHYLDFLKPHYPFKVSVIGLSSSPCILVTFFSVTV